MRAVNLFAAVAIPWVVAGTGGCALLVVGGAGAAGYAYVNGKCEKIYPYPMEQTWAAVRESVQEMNLPVLKERCDALSGVLESRTAAGEKVSVTLEPKGSAVTEVGIRVGVFGDETASRLLIEKIDHRLPGPYPPPRPRPEVHVGVSVSR